MIGGACSKHCSDKCIQHFNLKNQGKRPLGRLRRICEDNVEADRKEIGVEGVD
jgi:hypothetical protein